MLEIENDVFESLRRRQAGMASLVIKPLEIRHVAWMKMTPGRQTIRTEVIYFGAC